jgi:hypothetical protein
MVSAIWTKMYEAGNGIDLYQTGVGGSERRCTVVGLELATVGSFLWYDARRVLERGEGIEAMHRDGRHC